MHPFALERLGPLDVALFVKAGFKLHEHGDLLAPARCVQQRLHDRRVGPDAIQRLFYGQHIRIARRDLQKLNHRSKRVIGMVHKNILAANGSEDALGGFKCRRHGRNKGWIFEIVAVQHPQLH